MFNVGGGELLVILLVALIVLGPQRLPGAVRQAGQWLGELRKISAGFQTDLRSALDEAEREADASRRGAGTAAVDPSAPTMPTIQPTPPVTPVRADAGTDDPDEAPRAASDPDDDSDDGPADQRAVS